MARIPYATPGQCEELMRGSASRGCCAYKLSSHARARPSDWWRRTAAHPCHSGKC